jgi:DNA modification methylase
MRNDQIKTIQVPIDALRPAEYNPRKWPDKAIKGLTDSIKEFGLVDPIIVNSSAERKNIVIGGHFRLKIDRELGYTEIPVVYIDIPDINKEKELNIRLNKNLGEWDLELLANFDEAFLKDIGFNSKELDKIFADDDDQDGVVPEVPKKPKSKYGEIYQLGNHRVMCGDATKKEDLDKLMHNKKAEMTFTDPPYNIDYKGGMGAYKRNKRNTIMNDKMDKDTYYNFLYNSLSNMMQYVNGVFYICMGSKELHTTRIAFEEAGGHWQNYIVWVKNQFTLSRTDYQHQYEPILYGWKKGIKKHYFIGIRNNSNVWEDMREIKTEYKGGQTIIKFHGFMIKIDGKVEGTVSRKKWKSNIWRYDKPDKSPEHPTMKPVVMIKEAVLNSSRRKGIVLDTFGGSGSTLMACEKTNRTCYMMELDPGYVDVIIKRWEIATGRKAAKL